MTCLTTPEEKSVSFFKLLGLTTIPVAVVAEVGTISVEIKALMSYSSLLPCFDLKNPFINPELDDVHSPFGGFLKIITMTSTECFPVCLDLQRGVLR